MKNRIPFIFFLSALVFTVGVYTYAAFAKDPTDAFRSDIATYPENRDIPKSLYEKYYKTVGPKAMLSIIDERSKCHLEGHNLGRVIYDHTKDLPQDVFVCQFKCYAGCIHGALLEFVSEERTKTGLTGDPQPDDLTPQMMQKIIGLCDNSLITKFTGPASCYHSLGHVFAYFTDSDLVQTQKLCESLKEKGSGAVFHCMNGLYMQRAADYGEPDIAADPSKLYPCNSGDYPAACYTYKFELLYSSTTPVRELAAECNALKQPDRGACFYGLGSNYASRTRQNPALINEVCAATDVRSREMCLDGLIGRLASFGYASTEDMLCPIYTGLPKSNCLRHSKSMYDMTRDYTGYLVRREK